MTLKPKSETKWIPNRDTSGPDQQDGFIIFKKVSKLIFFILASVTQSKSLEDGSHYLACVENGEGGAPLDHDRVPLPPPTRDRTFLWRGRYASCVQAGRLSCFQDFFPPQVIVTSTFESNTHVTLEILELSLVSRLWFVLFVFPHFSISRSVHLLAQVIGFMSKVTYRLRTGGGFISQVTHRLRACRSLDTHTGRAFWSLSTSSNRSRQLYVRA